jgi:hypothetical protein
MQPLTHEQWQWLWNQRANTSPTPEGNPEVNDWLFEMITEAGYDVRDGVVVKLT